MSKLISILLITGIIVAGVSYAWFSDPEFSAHAIYKATLKEFAQQSGEQDKQFSSSQAMKAVSKKFKVLYDANENPLQNNLDSRDYLVTMTVSEKSISLVYETSDELLANQSIILEPVVEGTTVQWKCINGSVLVRVRTKNCRLGYGHTREEMSAF
jgi:hypothetical protein